MAGILRAILNWLTGRTSEAPPPAPAPKAPAPRPSPAPPKAPPASTAKPSPPPQRGSIRENAGRLRRRVSGRPGTGREGSPARPTPATARIRKGRQLAYAPELDGQADPGEIVWTWVAYEEDPSQGKDRPVLVVGRDGKLLLGLMLSSQSERQGQRHWLALGPGEWDREKRPSFVRLDRVIQVDEAGIRREGAVLDRARFDRIADVLRHTYNWA
ncbi:type II toxin-antitoxin system PemK/MazF family toxin [Catenuloplanes sp. NPDC051500]|uniref:type II toxin-antitoxin system PemK/MazF family toxin n=1 Tax=Catenuloplanes sp. NPDC051500 TaxID=3363959 RepID=UPI0037956252